MREQIEMEKETLERRKELLKEFYVKERSEERSVRYLGLVSTAAADEKNEGVYEKSVRI